MNSVTIPSSLECLASHNGLRPGEMSVLVGKSGHGKSALLKTIGVDAGCANCTVLHVLSEEKSELYKNNQARYINWLCEDIGKHPDLILDRMYYDSMLDWPKEWQNFDSFFKRLEANIKQVEPDLIIFDNFTTAFFDSLGIDIQGRAINTLREFATRHDIAMITAFHTKKGANPYNGILTGEYVRGNSTSTNAGSYNYILSTYFSLERPLAILFVEKTRYHSDSNKTFWILDYSKQFGIYRSAKKITEKELLNLINPAKEKSTKKIIPSPDWRK
jgi:hypothetical protein